MTYAESKRGTVHRVGAPEKFRYAPGGQGHRTACGMFIDTALFTVHEREPAAIRRCARCFPKQASTSLLI